MTTHRYRSDYKGPKRNIKDISNEEDCPCYECLVKSTCSRKMSTGDACDKFINYVCSKLKDISMGKDRGFTLIELLISFVIILVVLAIISTTYINITYKNTVESMIQEIEVQTLEPVEIQELNKSKGEKKKL
jgi:prepilin-type N-terminal cleavage/methylation domain-containing protein